MAHIRLGELLIDAGVLKEEQLKEALLAEYETDEATARRAVEDFVNTLKKENLLA